MATYAAPQLAVIHRFAFEFENNVAGVRALVILCHYIAVSEVVKCGPSAADNASPMLLFERTLGQGLQASFSLVALQRHGGVSKSVMAVRPQDLCCMSVKDPVMSSITVRSRRLSVDQYAGMLWFKSSQKGSPPSP